MMRQCSKCKKMLPATTDFFYRCSRMYDGLQSYCKRCQTVDAKKWYSKPLSKLRCKHVRDEYKKTEAGKLSIRKSSLKRDHNMTLEQYDDLLKSQDGTCKICGGVNLDGRRLSVDHNHCTGKVRGLLCCKCNSFIGFATDNVEILYKAIQYLTD